MEKEHGSARRPRSASPPSRPRPTPTLRRCFSSNHIPKPTPRRRRLAPIYIPFPRPPPVAGKEESSAPATPPLPRLGDGIRNTKAAAMGPYSSWPDLPADLLIRILQLLELPGALAFGAVCPSWHSASTAAGVPRSHTPWLVSCWTDDTYQLEVDSVVDPVTPKYRTLLNTEKIFEIGFPQGHAVGCFGASHGWLIVANELSNLVLYNPFTMGFIPLPPVTGFPSIEAVCGAEGNIVGYRYDGDNPFYCDRVYHVKDPGIDYFNKAVLSGSPSLGVTAFLIHSFGQRLSFGRAGERFWWPLSELRTRDYYADCVYHNGRFYTVTTKGVLKSWNPGAPNVAEVIIPHIEDDFDGILMRYLISAPWGCLLQVDVVPIREEGEWEGHVRVEIHKVHLELRRKVGLRSATALRGHAAFLGKNHSACLSTEKFPELRPDCIYFAAACLIFYNRFEPRHDGWGGVSVYDLKKQTFEAPFPCVTLQPWGVWLTPAV